MTVAGRIDGVFEGSLRGWAWNELEGSDALTLTVLADGGALGTVRADRFRGDLRRRGIGEGRHGFELALPLALQDGATHEFAVAVGARTLAVLALPVPRRSHMLQGRLERIAAGRIHGWAWDRARPEARVEVELLCDGVPLLRLHADRFRRDLLQAGIGAGAHGFVVETARLGAALRPDALLAAQALIDGTAWPLGTLRLPAASAVASAPPPPAPAATPAPAAPARAGALARDILERAREAERQGRYPAAAASLDEGLAAAPRDFDLLFTRARVAFTLGETELAERLAHAALAERPGHVRPSVVLARIASTRGDHAQAVQLWERVPPDDGNYRERLVKRGRSLMALGRPLEALAEFAAAAARDGQDRDALRGTAEAAEAAGAPRSALRHWRRFAALVPEDAAVRDRMQSLAQRLAVPATLASPLRDPLLSRWPHGVRGSAGAAPLEVAPGLILRSLAPDGLLSYAIAGARGRRLGGQPVYGLWLAAESGEAVIAFALDAAAATVPAAGLAMGIELAAAGTAPPLLLVLAGTGANRPLARLPADGRAHLTDFALRFDAAEEAAFRAGRLRLALRVPPGLRCTLTPPQPLSLLHERPAAAGGFEHASLAARLAAIGQDAVAA